MYRAQYFSENKEIISSGVMISFNQEPITIKVFEEGLQVVEVKFVFQNDSNIKDPKMLTNVEDDRLVFTLINFNNPIGTGSTKPINFATYKGCPLYIHFRVNSLGETDKSLYYSIYKEENGDGK